MIFDKQVVFGLGVAYAASPFSRVDAVALPHVAAETGDEKSPLDTIARKLADKAGKTGPYHGAGHSDTSKGGKNPPSSSKAHKDPTTTPFFVASASCAGDCISGNYSPDSHFLMNAIEPCDANSLRQQWDFLQRGTFTMMKSVSASADSTHDWCVGVVPQGDGHWDGAEAMCNSGAKLGLVHCGDAASLWYPTADQLVSSLCWSLGFTSLLTAEGCNELSLSMTTATDGATASITRDETFMVVDKEFIESFPPAPAPAPTPTLGATGEECFANRDDLKIAVDEYVSSGCNTGETACPDITKTYGWPMNKWCVGNVTDMSGLFSYYRNSEMRTFNDNISSWDVSQVQRMSEMFRGASAFNQDVSSWDVSQVTDMSYMFSGAESFNQHVSSWDVSQVQKMKRMFYYASAFNQTLSSWDVSQVTDMREMFNGARKFDQDVSLWNISRVEDMRSMFYYAVEFNQDLCAWADKNFPYNNTGGIFAYSACTYQDTPQEDEGGPFCASDCKEKEN